MSGGLRPGNRYLSGNYRSTNHEIFSLHNILPLTASSIGRIFSFRVALIVRWTAWYHRAPVTVFRDRVPRSVERLVSRVEPLLVPAPFTGTSSLRIPPRLLAPDDPHEPSRGSSRFSPPDCYQRSRAGTSSLLHRFLQTQPLPTTPLRFGLSSPWSG